MLRVSAIDLRRRTVIRFASIMSTRTILLATAATGLVAGSVAMYASHTSRVSLPVSVLQALPLNSLGILGGKIASIPVPTSAREPFFKAYCKACGCDVSEASRPLREYTSLSEFFARALKDGVRPIDQDAKAIVSPADGTIVSCGKVGPYGRLHVKGAEYTIRELLAAGDTEPLAVAQVNVTDTVESGRRLWYMVLRMNAANCHRFSSPADWALQLRRHVKGYLFWPDPPENGAYTRNERVILLGQWPHGLFSLTAIGAAGRATIHLHFEDKELRSERRDGLGKQRSQPHDVELQRGDPIGGFRLGSAIVLVFEAPEKRFEFTVQPGDKILCGQSVGIVRKDQNATGELLVPSNDEYESNSKTYKRAERPSRSARPRRYW